MRMTEHFKIACHQLATPPDFLEWFIGVDKHMGEQTTFDISANVLNLLKFDFRRVS